MVEIVRIPALSDNYIWLLHEPESGETAVVDPGVAEPVLEEAGARGWRIGQIWTTHWHPDHTGGNAGIKAATGATVTAPAAEAARIPTADRLVGEGDVARLGALEAQVMETPAHTAGHISYHLPAEQLLFVGDTMFVMGCGRLFEGTAEQMHRALRRYAALPPRTRVYCAHEYTLANARFAAAVEPGDQAIAQRLAQIEALRSAGEATVPTTIGEELATNLFVRAADAAALAKLREAKDNF